MATIDRRGISVSQVDSAVAGVPNAGLAIKTPCLVATTANIALSGAQTIDGVAVGANSERVLVWKQTDATTNGLYTAGSGIWSRTADADGNTDFASGMLVVIAAGTTYAHQTFQLQTADPVTLGSSAISFAQTTAGTVPTTRTLTTSAPITGGGDLSANRTFSLTVNGSLQVTGSALAIAAASGSAHTWLSSFNSAGVAQFTQPGFSDLSGNIAVGQMNGASGASATTFWCGDGSWKVPTSGGNVSNSGTPTSGQTAQWISSTQLKGVGPAAVANASPANPTGTGGTVMMGLGASCTLTPAFSTRAVVIFEFIAANNTATGASISQVKYGTGAAPANNAASTGTSAGTPKSFQSINANAPGSTTHVVLVTGLTPGTAYWFDIVLQAGGGLASITNVDFFAFEVP